MFVSSLRPNRIPPCVVLLLLLPINTRHLSCATDKHASSSSSTTSSPSSTSFLSLPTVPPLLPSTFLLLFPFLFSYFLFKSQVPCVSTDQVTVLTQKSDPQLRPKMSMQKMPINRNNTQMKPQGKR